MGIHLTDAILKTLSSGLLQETVILKLQGDAYTSISRICQDSYGAAIARFIDRLIVDRFLEEFHVYWRELVLKRSIKNVFDFERVFREFKRHKGLL
jgi:hypothetical protein